MHCVSAECSVDADRGLHCQGPTWFPQPLEELFQAWINLANEGSNYRNHVKVRTLKLRTLAAFMHVCTSMYVHMYVCMHACRNTVPHYHKLRSGVSHIRGNRRRQHIHSAMDMPCPGKTLRGHGSSPAREVWQLLLITELGKGRLLPWKVVQWWWLMWNETSVEIS